MYGRQCRLVRITQTFRMAKTAGALAYSSGPVWSLTGAARGAPRVRIDIEDDVVGVRRVAGERACHACHSIETVEREGGPNLPSHHVVGAGGVSADADPADSDSASIKCKSTAKHIHATDALADHRISCRAEVLSATLARLETGLA